MRQGAIHRTAPRPIDHVTLEALEVRNLRCIEALALPELAPRNLFFGPNGAGKTSIMEAIGLLSLGRTFQRGGNRDLIRTGCTALTVEGRVSHTVGPAHRYRIHKAPQETAVARDGIRVGTASELAAQTPVVFVTPDSIDIVRGGPVQRRQILDKTLFHVEQRFAETFRAYSRAAAQRAALLRRTDDPAAHAYWHRLMADEAHRLDAFRHTCASELAQVIEAMDWPPGLPRIAVEYRRGWPMDADLVELWASSLAADRRSGRSHYGPQRAELRFKSEIGPIRKLFSRGQARLVAFAVLLAQWELVRRRASRVPLIVVDDLGSDLAPEYRAWVVTALAALDAQLFITATERGLVPEPPELSPTAVFHVEHGTVQRR